MVIFQVERTVPLSTEDAWRRLTQWSRHGDVVPFTRVLVLTPPPTREGTVFVARSGCGPLAFDDRMEVTGWQPPAAGEPGRCRLEKRGRVVLGWAEIEVRPRPGGRTQVIWREELRVRFLPSVFDRLVKASAGSVFGRAADRLLRTP
ncbi:SRPBCC family protein [Streptomyces sp. AK04-3B]|uniref:SRPBCC family protein n=1 Tax=unclassified Streptomyces TaxID=2593676 RepID=UPI0029A44A44|nr:SRPBCC family protein [Streptomyces sp. AK04-3B]MDX3801499.1 SRPBCC family protein [Streptomyces sp. AK04-3B]